MHRVLLPFEFIEPVTVDDVVRLVDGRQTRALAGGVDLVLKMRLRQVVPDRVVSLRKVPDLDYVRADESGAIGRTGGATSAIGRESGGASGRVGGPTGALRFGALATLQEIERSPEVSAGWPLLAEAVSSIVSVQTKAMGTVVGNLCVGTPASDIAPALYVLDASVRIAGVEGERELPMEEFFVDSGKTALRAHEIVTEVVVPGQPIGTAGAFLKLAKTSEDIAKVNCAVWVHVDDGICTEARIALGSVAPTPVRAREAEKALSGRPLGRREIAAAARAAAAAVSPISDVRSTAAYRRAMARVLVRDALVRVGSRVAAWKEG